MFCFFNFIIHVLAYLEWKTFFFFFKAFLHGVTLLFVFLRF